MERELKTPAESGTVHQFELGEAHGSQEREAQIREEGQQDCRKRDAPQKERNPPQRSRRQRRQGEEPKAGNRDRAVRSPEEGRQGPQEAEEQEEIIEPFRPYWPFDS